MLRLGVHVSIGGSIDKAIDRARALECNTVQIFARNPRAWGFRPLDHGSAKLFRQKKEELDITPVIIHCPYLVNLAAQEESLFEKSVASVSEDMIRADLLGAEYVVTHIGSAYGYGIEEGIDRVCQDLERVLRRLKGHNTMLLLENTAGHGQLVGGKIEEIGKIIGNMGKPERLGFCLDTCHAFAGGYELRNDAAVCRLLELIDYRVGLDRLRVIHLNDSKGERGSHLDRHEDIGSGGIGMQGFRSILGNSFFLSRPLILETPKKSEQEDIRNLRTVRRFVRESGLIGLR